MHLKIGHPKRKLVFQPSIFRNYVSFREDMCHISSFFTTLKKTEVLLPVPVVVLEKVSPNLWQRCSQSCFTMIVLNKDIPKRLMASSGVYKLSMGDEICFFWFRASNVDETTSLGEIYVFNRESGQGLVSFVVECIASVVVLHSKHHS